jgi:hypothetical protein
MLSAALTHAFPKIVGETAIGYFYEAIFFIFCRKKTCWGRLTCFRHADVSTLNGGTFILLLMINLSSLTQMLVCACWLLNYAWTVTMIRSSGATRGSSTCLPHWLHCKAPSQHHEVGLCYPHITKFADIKPINLIKCSVPSWQATIWLPAIMFG